MALFFRAAAVDAQQSKPAIGRVLGAVGLLLSLFVLALVAKNNLAWDAPAETLLDCFQILFTAIVALFGFEGSKYLT